MSRSLNEITQEIAKFHEALNASGGDIETAAASMGMSVEQFNAAYDAIAFEDASKLDAYVYRLEESKARESAAQAMVDQWEARIQEWKAKVKAEQRDQEWMKSRLKFNMEAKGETKITTAEGRVISIAKNGGALPLVLDDEAFNSLDHDELRLLESVGVIVMQPVLSKEAVRECVGSGGPVEAFIVSKFAKVGERGTHLRIK